MCEVLTLTSYHPLSVGSLSPFIIVYLKDSVDRDRRTTMVNVIFARNFTQPELKGV